MKFTLKLLFAFCISLLTIQETSASHLMGGNITYNCVTNNSYDFTAQLYRDCNGITLPPTINVSISSVSCGQNINITLNLVTGSPQIVTPICPTEPDACNSAPGAILGIQEYTYTSSSPTVLPSTCNDWVISYSSCCRNGAITTGAGNSGFYISTNINNTNNICNNSPEFQSIPIFYACVGDTVSYNHGVSDADNDSLSFSLTPCLQNLNTPVSYATGYSATTPLGVNYSSFDNTTGTWTFVPSMAQTGVICMLVEEYRNGVKIGEVMRDIQIGVTSCSNQSPVLSGINGTATSTGTTGSNSITTCAGQNICFTIDAYDANAAQNVGINYTTALNGATYTVTNTGNTAQVTICWTPTLSDMGTNHFGLTVYDDNCPAIGKGNYAYKVIVKGAGGGATFSQTSIYQGSTAQLQVNLLDPSCTVNWTASSSLSCTNCLNPVASPTTTTTYYYNINCPSGGCGSFTDSVVVTVLIPKTLTGSITTSDGLPLANSLVYAYDLQGTILDTFTTDVNGNYSLSSNETSIYVSVTPDAAYFDQSETYYDASANLANATAYTFASGTNTGTLDFSTIEIAKTVSGIVSRSDGNQLSLSYVYLLDSNMNILDSSFTALTGQYTFTTFENNVHLLAVPNTANNDQIPTYYNGTIDPANAMLITFTSLQTTINFSTLDAPEAVVGTVTRADGLALDNSWVYLIDSSMMNIDSMMTSSQGYYAFVVPDVTINYYVKAIPGSTHGDQVITYYNGSETVQAATPISITTVFNVADFSTVDTFSLTGGKGIGGKVSLGTESLETPLGDVRLVLKDINGNFINDAITDDNGRFDFYGLVDGTYAIFVDKAGIDNELAPLVTLVANEPSLDDLEFLLHSYYLEMLDPNSTTEAFKAQNIAIFPNPIQTTFTIEYDLSAFANVQIDVLDVNGKVISSVLNENQAGGNHNLTIDEAEEWTNGVYFIRMMIDGQAIIQKVIKQ
ncbi:MAG: T9SS type A sorting domain-containing protein [Saprospiraceae bacterium]